MIKYRDELGRIKSPSGMKGKIIKICLQCGEKFPVYPYRKNSAKFHSRKCKARHNYPISLGKIDHSHLTKNRFRLGAKPWNKGKKLPQFTGDKACHFVKSIRLKCKNCGKIFFRKPWQCKRKNRKIQQFCLPKCRNKYYVKIGQLQKMSSIKRIPSRPEEKFIKICNKYSLPYKFVGDGKLWIENLNPDFINTNGEKILIEIFSSYYHDPKKNLRFKKINSKKFREQVFKKYGWKTIFFWDYEVRKGIVFERLNKNGCTKISI